MLIWSREGEAHTLSTYRRLLEESGFRAPDVHEAAGVPSRILVAERG